MSGATPVPALIGLMLLAACGATTAPDPAPPPAVPAFIAAEIETGADGLCYGRDITPAVLETVTAQVLETPEVRAEDGTVLTPAVYSSAIRQQIVRERQEVAFETLCPPAYTAEFVATLQRALAARGFYHGPAHGLIDAPTGAAVQAYQRQAGPDSPLLSIDAARALGIVALSDEDLAALG